MDVSLRAGKPVDLSMLVHIPKLVTAYYTEVPDSSFPEQRVAFGTSGHRGSAFVIAFNEGHILAISQAICLYREQQKIDGPLFLGMDTHALICALTPVPCKVCSGDEAKSELINGFTAEMGASCSASHTNP